MTKDELVAVLNAADEGPNCVQDGEHVALLFADGQIDSTKGGELFGMRNQFTFVSGVYSPIGRLKRSMSADESRLDLTYILCTHGKAKELLKLFEQLTD